MGGYIHLDLLNYYWEFLAYGDIDCLLWVSFLNFKEKPLIVSFSVLCLKPFIHLILGLKLIIF